MKNLTEHQVWMIVWDMNIIADYSPLVGCYNVFPIILIWRLILIYTINFD